MHARAGRDGDAAELGVGRGRAPRAERGGLDAQRLLDGRGSESGVGAERVPLLPVAQQEDERVRDEVHRRLVAADEDPHELPDDLAGAQRALVVDPEREQPGHDVVTGLATALLDDALEVPLEVDEALRRLDLLFGPEHRVLQVQLVGAPLVELRTVAGGDPEQVGDQRERHRVGEPRDQVGVAVGDEAVDELVRDLVHPRLHRGDPARGEHAHDELAQPRVERRIRDEERADFVEGEARVDDGLGLVAQRHDRLRAALARVGRVVAHDLADVGVAGDDPSVQRGAVEHRARRAAPRPSPDADRAAADR